MSRKVTAVLLCEDKQAQTLLYRYLKHERGFARVHVRPLPAGLGCGSQYVRERFADEVRKQRDPAVATVLVVHIDADNHSVADRKRQLAAELVRRGEPPRRDEEPIALVVPRWETENWLHHYLGRVGVSEAETYAKFKDDEARAAMPTVAALVRIVDGHAVAPDNLPALAEAAIELRRLV
jgi:hypothetical protein